MTRDILSIYDLYRRKSWEVTGGQIQRSSLRCTKTPCEFDDVTAKASVSPCYVPINGLLWDEVRWAGQPTGIS